MYDILIRGARVLDPSQGLDTQCDIALENGLISAVGQLGDQSAQQVICADGCVVTPGLIDMHAHLYPLTEIGISPEVACFTAGVTTVLDCGSAGAATYPAHRGTVLASRVRTRALLHVCSAGLATGRYLENPDPHYYDRVKISRCLKEYPELIGLKIRQGAEIVGELGLKPLAETIALADTLGVPVMVHCSNPPGKLDDMINMLRPGDILTHAYQDKGDSLLDEQGRISKAVWAARERGVIFDVANANIHFSFAVARRAIQEGFLPDTISTDLTTRSLYRRPAVFNLLHVMSKYLNLGLTLPQVIERCTIAPARIMGLDNVIGSLRPGCCADIAVLREFEHETEFGDRVGEIMHGSRNLRAIMTVRAGEIVYRDQEF
ncbi:MAG: amidohydrolase family protein [Candidatus Fimivivens sp.]|nr:amidohydrolase family protein [Candidatus Fimivivens sp.]